MLFNSAV